MLSADDIEEWREVPVLGQSADHIDSARGLGRRQPRLDVGEELAFDIRARQRILLGSPFGKLRRAVSVRPSRSVMVTRAGNLSG